MLTVAIKRERFLIKLYEFYRGMPANRLEVFRASEPGNPILSLSLDEVTQTGFDEKSKSMLLSLVLAVSAVDRRVIPLNG